MRGAKHAASAEITDCYKTLAYTIVHEAVKEYKHLCATSCYERRDSWKKRELERFFSSEWCELLSGIPRDRMELEAKKMKLRYGRVRS